MTDVTARRRLIPRTAIVAGMVSALIIVLAIAAAVLVARSRLVVVPDVVGLADETARARTVDATLVYEVMSTEVSVDVPAGSVISQDPRPGAEVTPGTTLAVVLSAGPQTVTVPDLVGTDVDDATRALETLGLDVTVETASSEITATVVLEMHPAPGATVSVGDAIRLVVPGEGSTDVLLPYDLTGMVFVLDPLPATPTDSFDVAIDVARRLQSLLKAGGATVTVTRAATETAPTPASRAAAARASGATVLIGIDLGRTGTAGLRVLYTPGITGDVTRAEESRTLAASITRAARLPGFVVNEPLETSDAVASGFAGTAVRVVVADAAAESDRARMIDPTWADLVARAIYRGVGSHVGAD
jgi:hypothetical protein